jgi:hypothetical protein
MEVIEGVGRIARLGVIRRPFEIADEQLAAWELPSELRVASTDEIEEDLALGHPAWGSLLRVTE